MRVGIGRNDEVGFASFDRAGDALKAALAQNQPNFWIARAKRFDHRRQRVSGVGMRRRNRQRAGLGVQCFSGFGEDRVTLAAHVAGVPDDFFAKRRQCGKRFAATLKQSAAERFLEQAQLLADDGLGRIEGLRGARDRQVVFDDCEEAQ